MKMKDLLQEGRTIQETFKKKSSLNESLDSPESKKIIAIAQNVDRVIEAKIFDALKNAQSRDAAKLKDMVSKYAVGKSLGREVIKSIDSIQIELIDNEYGQPSIFERNFEVCTFAVEYTLENGKSDFKTLGGFLQNIRD